NTQHDFELAGGYAWRHRLEAALPGGGRGREASAAERSPVCGAAGEQTVTAWSGARGSRLALAGLVISEPDLLLLDEPTNHLDLAAIEWLENYLLDFRGAGVIFRHDRFLIDRLA